MLLKALACELAASGVEALFLRSSHDEEGLVSVQSANNRVRKVFSTLARVNRRSTFQVLTERIFRQMPFSFSINAEHRFVHLKATGRVDNREMLACAREYMSHPEFDPGMHILIDLTADVSTPFDRDGDLENDLMGEMSIISREVRGEGKYKTACIGGSLTKRIFFVAATQMINPHTQVRACDTMDEALRWLDIGER